MKGLLIRLWYFFLQTVPLTPCPSGLPHNTIERVVTDIWGGNWCWHHECVKEALRQAKKRAEHLEVRGG